VAVPDWRAVDRGRRASGRAAADLASRLKHRRACGLTARVAGLAHNTARPVAEKSAQRVIKARPAIVRALRARISLRTCKRSKMAAVPLHILFSAAGAGALRQALVRNNRSDEVICLHDDLSFGPIDSLDPDARIRWLSRVCRLTSADWSWFADDWRMFWSHASSTARRRVVWSTRSSAREFAGFLAYLGELGDRPFTVVDGTNLTVPVERQGGRGDETLMSFGELGTDRMYSLLNTDRPLGTEQIMAFRDRWATLREEGALLRVVVGNDLTSVPLDFFDQSLLSTCTLDWQRAIRVIATAMFSTVADRLHAVDEMLLCSRMMALIESGRLEMREDIQGWPGDWLMREANLRLSGKSQMG
jgi:hypothetical protein